MKTPIFHSPDKFSTIRVTEPHRLLLREELNEPPMPLEFYCPKHRTFHPIDFLMLVLAGGILPPDALYRTTAPLPKEYTPESIPRDTAEASAPMSATEAINTSAAPDRIVLVDYKLGEVLHHDGDLWIISDIGADCIIGMESRKGTFRGICSRTLEELAEEGFEIFRNGVWKPCYLDAPKPPGLPAWQCHKKVNAFQIGMIEARPSGYFILHGVDRNHTANVSATWMTRNKTVEEGGYYIRYQDGYDSYSPREAFETGYSRL